MDVSLHFRPVTASTTLEVDADLLASLTQRAQQAALQAGPAARIDVTDLLRWPGVVREPPKDSAPLIAAAHALLEEALAELTRFRDSEGGRLKEALELRCAGLADFASLVAARLPEVRARIRTKLLERIAQTIAEKLGGR